MNVAYQDGRKELLTGLTPEQVAEHAKRVTADPAFDHAQIVSAGHTNRHERRAEAARARKRRVKP